LPRSADSAVPPRPLRLTAGAAIAIAVAALIGTLFWSILGAATGQAAGAPLDIGYLIYITTLQASLSTVLSLIVGIALAWALNRLRFPGPLESLDHGHQDRGFDPAPFQVRDRLGGCHGLILTD
jgi:thiamine transport system permease protein